MALSIDYSARIERIRRRMQAADMKAVICTRLESISFLAGVFAPAPWRAGVILPLKGEPQLVIMNADASRMQEGSWLKSFQVWDRADPMSFVTAASEALRASNCTNGKIGVEMNPPMVAGLLMVPEYFELARTFPGCQFVDAIALLDAEMIIKEPAEIERIRRAAEIADHGLLEAFKAIRAGATENEIAGVAEKALRDKGSGWPWAETTGTEVGSGFRSAYPGGVCQPATDKLLQLGDTVVVDVHSMYELYLCDTCGTAVVGKPTAAQEKLAEAWRTIALTVVEALRPGNKYKEVAARALRAAEKLGYRGFLVPTFGHGLGTAVGALAPFVSEQNEEVVQPNTYVIVLTALSQPGVGGLRLELPVLTTGASAEVLGRFPLDLYQAGS